MTTSMNAATWAQAEFGDKLVTKDGTTKHPNELVSGKDYVGIYFSGNRVDNSACNTCSDAAVDGKQ